jgi:site-specific DNA recombinase
VPAELFARVQAQKAERGKRHPEHSRRPKHLLAGLLKCGCCGSAMAIANGSTAGRRIWCGRRKEGGRCENGKTYALAPIEQRVVVALQTQLTDPRAIARYLETYQAGRRRMAKQRAGTRGDLTRKLGEVKREIDRIVDAIARGVISDAEVGERMPQLRQRRAQLEAELAALAPPPAKTVELHPATVARYIGSIEELKVALERRLVDGGEIIATALRDLVGAVVIHPRKGEPAIEVTGQLAALVGGDIFPQQVLSPTLVAGSGIEPPTYGL